MIRTREGGKGQEWGKLRSRHEGTTQKGSLLWGETANVPEKLELGGGYGRGG